MLCVLLITPLLVTAEETFEEYLDEVQRIEEYLFQERKYSSSVPAIYGRPRTNSSISARPLIVNITLTYLRMLELDEPRETISAIAETFIIWEDPRLRWDPRNFSEIDWIMTNRDKVWLADVLAYDLSDDPKESVPVERQNVVIFSNGSVYWYVARIYSVICELNISDFPFDLQICSINFAAYFSIYSEVQLNGYINSDLTDEIMGSNSWEVLETRLQNVNFTDSTHNWNYSEVKFLFKIKRNDSYYVILIIIPSFVLTFLCIAGLFWAPISFDTYMDKLNLGYAAILAMVLVLQITTDNIPKTSKIPILSIYSIINLFLITLASLTVLVIGKYLAAHKSDRKSSNYREFLRKRIHLICLAFYIAATLVNLIFLILRKGTSNASWPIQCE